MEEPTLIAVDGVLLVVDKPSGWVVHSAQEVEPYDVQAWLASHGHPGCSPLHRVDRGASGLVLFSADVSTRSALGDAFAKGEVVKQYLALVHGRTHRKGIVRVPVVGRPAVTRYRLLRPLGRFSLLRVRPETGRQHQIRRHLHGLGHPLVGDDRYRSRGFRPVPGFPGRLFLHAAKLVLPDGRSWESALPPELDACLQALDASSEAGDAS